MKEIIYNLEELNLWVQNFLSSLREKDMATIITLSGEVGAGKTTLTQLLAQALGVIEPITSPTFVIQKEYEISTHGWINKMIHIDAYRLEQKKDLEYLGWNTLIKNPSNIIIIEWPEMVKGIEMPESISLHLDINEDHTRTITTL